MHEEEKTETLTEAVRIADKLKEILVEERSTHAIVLALESLLCFVLSANLSESSEAAWERTCKVTGERMGNYPWKIIYDMHQPLRQAVEKEIKEKRKTVQNETLH